MRCRVPVAYLCRRAMWGEANGMLRCCSSSALRVIHEMHCAWLTTWPVIGFGQTHIASYATCCGIIHARRVARKTSTDGSHNRGCTPSLAGVVQTSLLGISPATSLFNHFTCHLLGGQGRCNVRPCCWESPVRQWRRP